MKNTVVESGSLAKGRGLRSTSAQARAPFFHLVHHGRNVSDRLSIPIVSEIGLKIERGRGGI